MNNLKPAVILLSLGTLFGCGSDDSSTKYSDDYITTPAPIEEETDPVEETDPSDPIDADNLVANGDFESWTELETGIVPDSWTTIDSDMTVAPNTEFFTTGETSAEFTVNATKPDFRQSVDVVAGTEYTLSTWIYHTEGGVKARLYIDNNWPNTYSDSNLVNEWQEITYSYTASTTGSVELGMRFYAYTDAGFDGSEIVYSDNMTLVAGTVTEPEEPEPEEPVVPVIEDPVYGNLLNNADFEYWTDAVLDDWSSETGTTITQNTEIFNRSLASAEVLLTTSTQGDTDLRQTVSVEAGTTYDYSTWIYHTAGTAYVALYIDETWVPTTSDHTVLNQWQEVTYSYTATESKEIEVGVRFYDVAATFDTSEIVYIDNFSLVETIDLSNYYDSAANLTGYELKTALFNIINDHTQKSYSDVWDFMSANSLDVYYENDNSIIDMYSENPEGTDSYNFTPSDDQCGNYSGEGSCYNREHSFPKSWFDDGYPMYTDIHHLFSTDGYVNGKRSNNPFGEVGTVSWTSDNGSLLGSGSDTLGYTSTVFEPIDEFKGDFARAYFYMATRYEDVISTWSAYSDNANAVLDGSADKVYEDWTLTMLKEWHKNDPVSQKEIDRNEAAYLFQGNRNPFIDNSDYVTEIWGD